MGANATFFGHSDPLDPKPLTILLGTWILQGLGCRGTLDALDLGRSLSPVHAIRAVV